MYGFSLTNDDCDSERTRVKLKNIITIEHLLFLNVIHIIEKELEEVIKIM